jgi:iron complex transport system ATP-binding protein
VNNAEPALSVERVTVSYGERTALHHVDLVARPGELVALTGPNGSGKTTLIRAALGLVAPSDGEIRLFGRPTAGLTMRERARRVAWVPQEEAPQDNVGVRDYVLYGRYAHLPPFTGEGPTDQAAADRALEDVGLSDRAGSGILELSGGERQRLLLARGLAQEAPLLLLDEPTAHLDIGHQLDLLDRVRRLVRERKVCAVAALHDLNLAGRYADRVVVLSHGRLVADGPPDVTLTVPILRTVWGVEAERRRDPRTGATYLVPYRPSESPSLYPPGSRGRVHVIGGGGAASPLLRALVDAGWSVSAGILPLLDSDAEAAEELGVPFVPEIPFSPIGEEARIRQRARLAEVQAIVVAPIVVGPSNAANLEELRGWPARTPVLFVETGAFEVRDFTGGAAGRTRAELLNEGAEIVPDVGELLRRLEALSRARGGLTTTPRP